MGDTHEAEGLAGTETVVSSLEELATCLRGDQDSDALSEDPRELVQDVLTEYADWDVWIMDHGDDSLTVRIGARGIGLPFPFRLTELLEAVDELSNAAFEDAEE